MLSTKREPSTLGVPKLPLRQRTPGRIDLSAVLLVGSTPSTGTNVHNASRRFRMSRHVPAVLGTPHRLPASKSRSTSRRSGLMEERKLDRCRVPARTRCHQGNIWGSVTDSCAMTPWRKGVHSSRAIASKALAGAHRTNYIDIQQVVKQSQPASMMTLDKLSPSFTGRIRISTVICYASSYAP